MIVCIVIIPFQRSLAPSATHHTQAGSQAFIHSSTQPTRSTQRRSRTRAPPRHSQTTRTLATPIRHAPPVLGATLPGRGTRAPPRTPRRTTTHTRHTNHERAQHAQGGGLRQWLSNIVCTKAFSLMSVGW
jgi:hypothetical protein